ncbi:Peptidoglycan glycosyltransferase FtsW (EC 2.4.1.129) [uncultured Gammaproteobacteria bacterium]|jgi:cell division protein FtsW|nr:Peptidoglycan glycosyltransferase FtsW (EC [Bathymodiolus brooksi thiotrophic gill symbiont]CAC9563040.1 Peptidoglycan glycosyltransferase FtsW (EC 2.4.1.129) [uncultured Gammaproteobacteria bacterium]CAC9576982.1 Peptidoglycan glycosyltransferase FtsW (EC 2.4.1.129) [uncultured Gammaproteobacteria bacterium]CAC9599751.1 Peptidoglycan glycosyltransferase FtsW (EC 2.4.1.129) [uncultured Gammaproteobacteria bacterium]CAC9618754.1 Peptidoglycan glycosyltransferase FtsW (EC 2.4.1.129) [unculture
MFSKIFNKTAQLPDKNLLFAILALIIFGWILSSSASIGHFGNYSKAINQAVYITFGMFLGFFVLKVPLSFYKDNRYWLFLITIVLLAVVFSPIGKTINGSTRWIDLVAFRLQPSEILKIVIILFTAGFLVEQEKDLKHPWLGFFKVLVIISIPGILLLLESDFGATIIVVATVLSMLLAAGVYLKQLFIVGGVIILSVISLISLNPNRVERFTSFWREDLWLNHSDKVWQTKQALVGIARGDWTGVGLGNSIQKYTKLPEPHTDMIFAVIGEEIGIIGMLFVISTFTYIILKGFKIAREALKDNRRYSSYVGFGICTWLSMQFSVNIAMNLGLIPPKGFTLPLVSYGGSSMIFALISMALLLRINMENKADSTKRKHYV